MLPCVVHVIADPAGRFDLGPQLQQSLMQPTFVSVEFGLDNISEDTAWQKLFELSQ